MSHRADAPAPSPTDLDALLRAAPASFLVLLPDAPDFRIVEATDAYLTMSGTRREDLVGRGIFEAFFPDPPALDEATAELYRALRDSLERVLATGRPDAVGPGRYDLTTGRGRRVERRWFATNSPVLDANGRIQYVVHHAQDVIAAVDPALRREAEEARRRAEAAEVRLRQVYEQAPVAIAVLLGPEHRFEVANPRYSELVDKPREALLGRTVREVFPELESQGIYDLLDRVYATGETLVAEELPIRIRQADGGRRELVVNFVYEPLRDEAGAVEGIAAVATDVTALVRAREAAVRVAAEHEAERRQLLTVLEQAPLAIAITSPTGAILYRNPTFDRLWGRPAHETRADAYSEVYEGYHLDGRPIASTEWAGARAVLQGEVVEGEVIEIVQASGRRITVWINSAPVRDAEGRIAGGVVMFRDITAERRTEQQLQNAQRMQAVGTLAGGVAHEINNQMTAVLGFGSFVLKALGADHPQAADMRVVLQSAERAARISQQLLAFTRQQVMQPRRLDLVALVAELRPVLQQLLGTDKTLRFAAPDRVLPAVSADPDQVQQVLINLVANARDAVTTGATVVVTADETTLDVELPAPPGDPVAPGRYVVIAVRDTGHGMPPEILARIFDPFFTTKGVGQGSGLGLAMVYGTMRRHGGYVVARSAPGEGTTMELYWPVADDGAGGAGEAAADGAADAAGGTVRRAAVLVVEDEPVVRTLAVRALEEEGYAVAAAEDGRAALEALERGGVRPDAVVTDVIMPRMNGRQLSDAIAARWPGLPVLFMSGHTGTDDVLQRLVPPGAPFLQKPFTPEALARAVAELLATARPR